MYLEYRVWYIGQRQYHYQQVSEIPTHSFIRGQYVCRTSRSSREPTFELAFARKHRFPQTWLHYGWYSSLVTFRCFSSLTSLSLVLDVRPLARFGPRSCNLIKFCVDLVTCCETICSAYFGCSILCNIRKDFIPVRKVSRPKALATLQRMGFNQRNKLREKFPNPCTRWRNGV